MVETPKRRGGPPNPRWQNIPVGSRLTLGEVAAILGIRTANRWATRTAQIASTMATAQMPKKTVPIATKIHPRVEYEKVS